MSLDSSQPPLPLLPLLGISHRKPLLHHYSPACDLTRRSLKSCANTELVVDYISSFDFQSGWINDPGSSLQHRRLSISTPQSVRWSDKEELPRRLRLSTEEEYLGHPPSLYDLFMYTHTKDHDGKTLLNDRAKQVHDYFLSKKADLVEIGEEVDDNGLFYNVVGGHDRKRRIYGLGAYGKSILLKNSSQASIESDQNLETNNLVTKIQKLEEIVEQQRMELDEMKRMVDNMRATHDG